MLMPGERPSQHGHSSNPSTTFSGPSSLNVSTTLCSLMVILLCPLPLLRQGVCFGCALIAHHFSGATPSLRTEGLRRDLDAGARNLQACQAPWARPRERWRVCSGERRPPMEASGADSHPSLGAARTVRRLRARAARATAEKLAPERRAAPIRVAGSRGGVIAQRALAAWNMITARPRPLPPRDLVRWERRPAVPALIWSSQRPARVCSRQRTGPWHKPGRSTRRPTRKRKAPRYRPPDLQPARRVW